MEARLHRAGRVRRPTIGALAVVLALGPGGCSFGGDEIAERVQEPMLVSRQAVERQAPGSPARALLEWWRTMQFDDAPAAAGLYSERVEIDPKRLADELELAGAAFDARPGIVEVQEEGRRATVLALLERRTRNPNGRVDVLRRARAFHLVREDGAWKLADNRYLERAARTVLGEALREQSETPP